MNIEMTSPWGLRRLPGLPLNEVGSASARRALAEFGFTEPVLVDEDDHVLHNFELVQAAIDMGLDELPVVRLVGWSHERKLALAMGLRRISGKWHEARLSVQLEGIRAAGLDLSVTGFTPDELKVRLEGPKMPDLSPPTLAASTSSLDGGARQPRFRIGLVNFEVSFEMKDRLDAWAGQKRSVDGWSAQVAVKHVLSRLVDLAERAGA